MAHIKPAMVRFFQPTSALSLPPVMTLSGLPSNNINELTVADEFTSCFARSSMGEHDICANGNGLCFWCADMQKLFRCNYLN